jgi:adenosine deaminase
MTQSVREGGPLDIAAFAAAMPKVSLHCHLEGAVAATTVVDLARKHGIALPGGRNAETLYDVDAHADLTKFLRVYDMVATVVRTADDFERITYETLALAAEHHVLYREMFVSPQAHDSVPWHVQLDGMTAGIRAAEQLGIRCKIIVAIDRELSPSAAEELVETVIEHRTDDIIGVGLDHTESLGPPAGFTEAFRLAGRAGLHRTAHSESGPPRNILTLLDDLGCTRVDHGYHVVTDQHVMRRCLEEGIAFTCTPISSDIGRYSGSGDGTHEIIGAMIAAGLTVAIDSDDPPMFHTDPTNDLLVLARARSYDDDALSALTHNAVRAAWLDDTERAALQVAVETGLRHANETLLVGAEGIEPPTTSL